MKEYQVTMRTGEVRTITASTWKTCDDLIIFYNEAGETVGAFRDHSFFIRSDNNKPAEESQLKKVL